MVGGSRPGIKHRTRKRLWPGGGGGGGRGFLLLLPLIGLFLSIQVFPLQYIHTLNETCSIRSIQMYKQFRVLICSIADCYTQSAF